MRELANEEGATRKASVERLLVYSTLPKVRATQEREIRKFGNERIGKWGVRLS